MLTARSNYFGASKMQLFQPDKYQECKPVFCRAINTDRTVVSALLSEEYGIHVDQGPNVDQAGGAEINSNNFRVETTDQRLLVKRFNCSKQDSILKQKLSLYRWLHNHGIPVPIVLENRSKQLLTSYSGSYWCVMDFIEGTYFNGTNHQIEEAARVTERLFKRLDKTSEKFVQGDDRVEMLCASKAQELMAWVENHWEGCGCLLGHEAATALLNEWPTIKQSADLLAIKKPSSALKYSLTHNDLHPYNLLFNAGHVVSILDFESFRIAPRSVMISFSAYKLLRRATTRALSHDHGVLQALVAKYRSGLSNAEFLPSDAGVLARMEILRRLFFILDQAINHKKVEWRGDLQMHVGALQEAKCLFPESDKV